MSKKQVGLGAFGFTKIVTRKDGVDQTVDITKIPDIKKLQCPECFVKLGNEGALAVHIKCKHSVLRKPSVELVSAEVSPQNAL